MKNIRNQGAQTFVSDTIGGISISIVCSYTYSLSAILYIQK